ncbi:MAG: DEDD exonuclease domain-containing protein [Propionibacteriaceae bacterium]|nr:DEDD exonuclease domain-containing protein [Propionibacteriaceae bacterium]
MNPWQPSFDDLGTPLIETTFCVVDLETTGGDAGAEITEIGAVLVRGGEVLGEFQTLVRPRSHIPASIQVMTGITTAMVADAPRIEGVLGSFLQFSTDAVLVAHNARFDIGFLTRACASAGFDWPSPTVIDTLALARCALSRDEVRNCKLDTLAGFFGAATQPNHRALSDARATVDVLHGLIERVGNLGVHTLDDLMQFTHQVSPGRRAKRVWAKSLPEAPGVYWFRSDSEVLYIGKATNLRRRVGSYFTAAERRGRIHEMLRVATGVEHLPCATALEAGVRELRLIEAHSPRYNRRSRRQRNLVWLTLTPERFPRLSIVRQPRPGVEVFGPFPSKKDAETACLALYDAFAIRRCTTRLSGGSAACALAGLGRCLAPCEHPDGDRYGEAVAAVRESWRSDIRPVLSGVSQRLVRLTAQQRYEEAGELAERMRAYEATSRRWHRLRSLASCAQIVAAARERDGWAVHVVRYGKLAHAAHSRPGESPLRVAQDAVAAAEAVLDPGPGRSAASVEETELIASWLETPGVRLIELTGEWAWPTHSGLTTKQFAQHLLGAAPGAAV